MLRFGCYRVPPKVLRFDRNDSFENLIAAIIARMPRLNRVICISSPPFVAMPPKEHRCRAIPKAKRNCTGDTRRLRYSVADTIPDVRESTCMIVCSQLGFGMVGVPASAADFVKFAEYLDSGDLGFVIVAFVHRVPMLPCEISLAHFTPQCLTQILFASAAERGAAQKR